MVKLEFTSKAVEGYQGFAGEQELSFGNAFAGAADKAAYDREMWNALHAASILGDEATMPSNIANAQLRMTSSTSETGSKKKGGADKGLSVQQMIMLQNLHNLISDIDGQIADLNNSIEFLESIEDDDAIMTAGSYEELSATDQERLDRYLAETGQTREEHFLSTHDERLNARDEALEAKRERINSLEEIRADLITLEELNEMFLSGDIQNIDTEKLGIENNAFSNEILELAAQKWEEEHGELDRYNMNSDTLYDLLSIIDREKTLETHALADLEGSLLEDNLINQQAALASSLTFR